jgi:lysophospholipase L1-like esterase
MKISTLTFITILISIFTVQLSLAQDWANLERFKEDNAQLKVHSVNLDGVVFMGNSITQGWLQDSLSFFYTKSYINRGISGQTTPQMLIRFRADVVDLEPSVVVILAGINDIAGNTGPSTIKMIVDNISSMVEIAMANEISVVLCSVLPALDFPWNPGMNPSPKVIKLNALLKDYADENKLVYLDYYTSMVDEQQGLKKEYTYDGVHPNKEGYRVMELLAEQAIEKALLQYKVKQID